MSSGLWKTIILPPLFALLVYLLLTYAVVPLYQRFVRHSNTSTLGRYAPVSIPNQSPTEAINELAARLSALLGRPRRPSNSVDGGLFLGDEELEEGNMLHNGENRVSGAGEPGNGRRLSRELEGGFMDDSDDEDRDSQRVLGRSR